MGSGYCFQGGLSSEEPYRLTDWIQGDLEAAKEPCTQVIQLVRIRNHACENPNCVGFHLDLKVPDFVLLSQIGVPNNQDPTNRLCYRQNLPSNNPMYNHTSYKIYLTVDVKLLPPPRGLTCPRNFFI